MDLQKDLRAAILATLPDHPGRDALLRLYAANVGDPNEALPPSERHDGEAQ